MRERLLYGRFRTRHGRNASAAAAKGTAVELPTPAAQGPGKGAQGAQEIVEQL